MEGYRRKRDHPLNRTYWNMRYRCENRSGSDFHNYGGRGIAVCDRWLGADGFLNFIADMGSKPEGYTLDRVDNNKGYSPANCRWADRVTQNLNRRLPTTNKSGFRHAFKETGKSKYRGRYTVNGKKIHVGYYETPEEAELAVANARSMVL